MRAVVVKEFGGPEALVVIDTPAPEPGPGEVRLTVAAASVSPADVLVRLGAMVQYGSAVPTEQFGIGVDVAGTIDALGEGVRGWSVGDAVIGLQERLDLPLGTQAEHVVLEEWAIAPAPAGMGMAEASTLPLNATTADQALDALDLAHGQWLLVTGAAGGVGAFAVELAVLRGLRVVAQAGADDEGLVRGLGAELFVPRTAVLGPTVRQLVPGGADGALDAAGLGVGAYDAVRHRGAYVNLLNSAPQARRGIRTTNLAYSTDGHRLTALSALAAAGRLTPRVARTYALEEAPQAHEDLAAGGVRGRLVLVP